MAATPSGGAVTPPNIALPVPEMQEQQLQPPPIPGPEEQPKGAGFMGTTGKVADIASSVLSGWMKGLQFHQQREQQKAQQDVAGARANMSLAWDNFTKVSQDPNIPTIKEKLQGQTQAGSAVQPILNKFLSGQQLSPDEQKQIQDLQQHALTPAEQASLQSYQQAQQAWLAAGQAFSNTASKYMVQRDQTGKGAKGALKKVGNQFTGKGQNPQFFAQSAIDTWNKLYPTLTPPTATPEQRAAAQSANEFLAGAPTRAAQNKNEAAAAEAQNRLNEAQKNLSAVVGNPNAPLADVKKAQDDLAAARDAVNASKGVVKTPSEQLSDQLAQVGIGALDKAQQGIPQSQWSPAEISFYNKTFPKDIPQNMWDYFMQRAAKGEQFTDAKGAKRAYTENDAMQDYMHFEERLEAIRKGPNATQELISELTTLSKQIDPNMTPAQRAKWISDRLSPAAERAGNAQTKQPPEPEVKRITNASFLSVAQAHPELAYLAFYDPDAKIYGMNPKPGLSKGFFSGDRTQSEVDADSRQFETYVAKEMQQRGATPEMIKNSTGIDVEQMSPPPAPAPGPPTVGAGTGGLTPPPAPSAAVSAGLTPPPRPTAPGALNTSGELTNPPGRGELTVRMKGPKGTFDVPKSQQKLFESNGYAEVGQQ
jgi:hypothetical protein